MAAVSLWSAFHPRSLSRHLSQRDALPDQFLARDDERPDRMGGKRLHMDRFVEPGAGKMCQPARVVVSLVRRQRLQRPVSLAAFDAHHRLVFAPERRFANSAPKIDGGK